MTTIVTSTDSQVLLQEVNKEKEESTHNPFLQQCIFILI